jgi:ferritin-like metal-binding protein YciE
MEPGPEGHCYFTVGKVRTTIKWRADDAGWAGDFEMSIATLEDMFIHVLNNISHAENRSLKALPKLLTIAHYADLKAILSEHLTETEQQTVRLERIFELLGIRAGAETCLAVEAILAEAGGMLAETSGTSMRDLAVILSCQAIKHYEIVRYRSLVEWAKALEMTEAAGLLQQSLDEEISADTRLLGAAAYALGETDREIEEEAGPDPAPRQAEAEHFR